MQEEVEMGKRRATPQDRAKLIDALSEHEWYARYYKGLIYILIAVCVGLVVLFILSIVVPEWKDMCRGVMAICGGAGIFNNIVMLYVEKKIGKYRKIVEELRELDGIADGKIIKMENGELMWKRSECR